MNTPLYLSKLLKGPWIPTGTSAGTDIDASTGSSTGTGACAGAITDAEADAEADDGPLRADMIEALLSLPATINLFNFSAFLAAGSIPVMAFVDTACCAALFSLVSTPQSRTGICFCKCAKFGIGLALNDAEVG